MFESDDFDQVLSQFDFHDIPPCTNSTKNEENIPRGNGFKTNFSIGNNKALNFTLLDNVSNILTTQNSTRSDKKDDISLQMVSTKVLSSTSNNKDTCFKSRKRKNEISYPEHEVKRKFPGPAGLLTETPKEDNHLESLSQDIEYNENRHRHLFISPLWMRLLEDIRRWNISNTNSIKLIKEQAMPGNLQWIKAQTVTAFVESVDRSAPDPLVTLRDATGNIECTLHRDAWSAFSPYIIPEHCALVLSNPTVITIGNAFKKHYLNINMCNIYAIYSSAVLEEEEINLPEGYTKMCTDEWTVIKTQQTFPRTEECMKDIQNQRSPQNVINSKQSSQTDSTHTPTNIALDESSELLDELDSIFSDDLF